MTDDRYPYGAASHDGGAEEIPDNLGPPSLDVDLDAFLDYVSELAGETRRRTASRSRRLPVPSAARDSHKRREPKVELVLYTSRESEKSQRAIRAVEEVLTHYDRSQVRLTMCDLSARPEEGEADSVVFTPTLVKQGPGPKTAIIGNLDGGEVLRDLLDSSGVDRRWDD
jgi:hypothetical protein